MLKLCGWLEKIRHGLPSSPISKKNQKRRSVSSQIRFDPFPHLRGHFGDARTSRMHNSAQITVRPAEPRRYDYRIVQLSVSSTVSLSL